MDRRNFLIFFVFSAGLFILMVLICSASPPFLRFRTPAPGKIISSGSAPQSCTLLITQDSSADYNVISTNYSQSISNSASVSVCQVDLYLYDNDSSQMNVVLSSEKGLGGTIYGTSDTKAITTSIGYVTFTFDPPVFISGDFWINPNVVSGSIARLYYNTSDAYMGTSYFMRMNTDRTTYDMRFKIYTMQ